MKNLLLIISILFISTIQAFACFAEEIEFSEDINFRTANSELIVEGKVVNQEGFWNEDKTLIYTAHEVQLYKVLKGKATTDRVIVISEGGVVGNKSMTNTVSPEIALNDYGVFFVNPVTKSYKFNGTDLSYQYFTSLYFKAFIKYNTTLC